MNSEGGESKEWISTIASLNSAPKSQSRWLGAVCSLAFGRGFAEGGAQSGEGGWVAADLGDRGVGCGGELDLVGLHSDDSSRPFRANSNFWVY